MSKLITEKSKKLFKLMLEDKNIKAYLKLLKAYHKESYFHSLRVGFACVKMGFKNSLSENDIKLLGDAGLLHDLGKLEIPKEILTKNDKMNFFEKKIMLGHPRIGFLKLQDVTYSKVREIIISHHEFKSHPYPRQGCDRRKKREGKERRKKDDLILKLAQILSIVDMYDALSHKRDYKIKFDKKKIKNILAHQFNGDKIYLEQVLEN